MELCCKQNQANASTKNINLPKLIYILYFMVNLNLEIAKSASLVKLLDSVGQWAKRFCTAMKKPEKPSGLKTVFRLMILVYCRWLSTTSSAWQPRST